MRQTKHLGRCVLLGTALALAPILATAEVPYEEPPILQAADLLPAELLKGERHAVDPDVPTDGFLAYFTIHSDYGTFQAASLEEARVRIREVLAIAELDDMKRYEVAGKGVVEGIKQPFLAVRNIATRPQETAQNIGKGIGRWVERGKLTLRKVGRKAKQGVDTALVSLDEKAEARQTARLAELEVRDRAIAEDRDPEAAVAAYRERQEARAAASKLAAESDAQRQQERVQWAQDQLKKASMRYIGYDKARRGLAMELGVDPYSTNLALQERLDAMAWAVWAGRMASGYALPSSAALGYAKDVNKLVWERSPKDLEVENRKLLAVIGVDRATENSFFDNPYYSTSDQTQMIADLASLEGVANRDHFFRLAEVADGALRADFYRRTGQILVGSHEEQPLERIIAPTETIVVALTRSGDLLLILAVDHLAWTEDLDLLTSAVDQKRRAAGHEGGVRLLLAGDPTARARQGVEGLGWKIDSWGLERLRKPSQKSP